MRTLFNLKSRAALFRRDTRGNVAMVFGLSAIPVSIAIAAGVDYARFNSRQAIVQDAIDSAVLQALDSANGSTPSDAQTRLLISAALGSYGDIQLTQGTSSSITQNGKTTTTVSGSGGSSCSYATTVTPQTSTCANTTLTYTAATSSSPATYQVTIKGTYTAALGSTFGSPSFTRTATARMAGSLAPSSTQFKLTAASGWYAKTVKVWTHTAGAAANSNNLLATYTYAPTDLNSSNTFTGGGGVGPTTATFADGTTTTWDTNGNVVSGTNESVSLGTNYDNAWLTMDVFTDFCPAGQTPDPRTTSPNLACLTSGTTFTSSYSDSSQFPNDQGNLTLQSTSSTVTPTTSQQYVCTGDRRSRTCQWQDVTTNVTTYTYTWQVTKQASAVTYSTADPTSANHLFVMNSNRASTSADDMPLGTNLPISLFTMIPCGKTVYHSWEDTPWSSSQAYTGSWAAQDIYFQVAGTTCAANASYTNGATGSSAFLSN